MIEAQRGVSPPDGVFVLPRAGSREFAVLVRKVRLLAARALLTGDFATPMSAPVRRALQSIQPVLTDALRRRTDDVLSAAGSPDVLPFLLGACCGSIDADAALASAVPNLLSDLHLSGVDVGTVTWTHPVNRIATRACSWVFSPAARALAVTASELRVQAHDGTAHTLEAANAERVRVPLARFGAAIHFALHDTNPLSLQEAHPEKSGNALDLGGRSCGEWLDAIDAAMELIEAGIPEWYAELPDALHRIVPVGFETERHLSASYREAPGLVYMSLHPDPLTMAEAIVHETQHTKVNALTWLDPVLINGQTEWTSSPVRPDLRPLMGVLLAVHAFVPVAAMHYGLAACDHPISRSQRFRQRREEVLKTNASGLETLRGKGQPTAAGAQLIDSLERVQSFLSGG